MKRPTTMLTSVLVLGAVAACQDSPVEPGSVRADELSVLLSVAAEPHVWEFTTLPGDPVFLNPPSATGGGGLTATLYDTRGKEVGSWTTDFAPSAGKTVFDVISEVLINGSASVGPVNGTFVANNGTILDVHDVSLQITGPASTPGYEITVLAVATGDVVEGSTGAFDRDGGQSDLSLLMEFDVDLALPARAVEASWVFVLD